MARTGHEVPLWPIGPEFWMLIEQSPDSEYNLLAAALADSVTRLKHQWFYEQKNAFRRWRCRRRRAGRSFGPGGSGQRRRKS
eukprot:11177720-Prorocentrum_lima.AAC.1